MHVINVRNVNAALETGLAYLSAVGTRMESRNGTVLVAPGPVATVYRDPWERVLFSATRDANPFFHLMESLWMLAGRNDVELPAHYATQMQLYSDDGETLNGAYGYRWRKHFGFDQLATAIEELKRDRMTRRVVVAMWDGGGADHDGDLKKAVVGSKDVPCNTHIYFTAHNRLLEMTVCCRSNDVVWGAYGANAVHFSVLQEYVAAAAGLPIGPFYQLSNNYHAYIERPDTKRLFERMEPSDDRYLTAASAARARAVPISFRDREAFDQEVERLLSGPSAFPPLKNDFLRNVVVPMKAAHYEHRLGNTETAIRILSDGNIDWHIAGREWLARRLAARKAKEQAS